MANTPIESTDLHNMAFDQNSLCHTTGWYNNCGLNCLTHFIVSKLENGELQNTHSKDPAYKDLLACFAQYYQLSKTPSLEDIDLLFKSYPAASDQEFILGPVLRKYLEQTLLKNKETLWQTYGSTAISDYLLNGEVNDIARPIFDSNEAWFERVKANYDAQLNRPPTDQEIDGAKQALVRNKMPLNQQNIANEAKFIQKNNVQDQIQNEAIQYWNQTACQNYAQRMGDLFKAQMVSADQLSYVMQSLGIGLTFYIPGSDRPNLIPEPGYSWLFKVYNHGAHWEYEEFNQNQEKTSQHNQYYGASKTPGIFVNKQNRQVVDGIIHDVKQQFELITDTLSSDKLPKELVDYLAKETTEARALMGGVTPAQFWDMISLQEKQILSSNFKKNQMSEPQNIGEQAPSGPTRAPRIYNRVQATELAQPIKTQPPQGTGPQRASPIAQRPKAIRLEASPFPKKAAPTSSAILTANSTFEKLPLHFQKHLVQTTKEASELMNTTPKEYWNKIANVNEKNEIINDFKKHQTPPSPRKPAR